VFHDDQHGTAIVVLAALINSLRLMQDKKANELKVVINGGGAAGLSICQMLLAYGIKYITVCDTKGAIYRSRTENMNEQKHEIANITNYDDDKGPLEEIIKNCHVFIGVSAAGALKAEWIYQIKLPNPIIFALANPVPEIYPAEALEAGAYIVGTGRSDFPNQINNSLAFPGIFRAVLDVRATEVTMDMKLAAAKAIAHMIPQEQLSTTYIMPDPLDYDIPTHVAAAVAKVAIETGYIKKPIKTKTENLKAYFKQYSTDHNASQVSNNL
jgi:malate dehydrogenase (oxaloacetate-decarboxylating)